MGGCLGNALALLRKASDHLHEGENHWWSDQGHCALKKREHDSGRTGQPLTSENYYPSLTSLRK